MPHVVPANLAGGVREPVWKGRRGRVEQEPRAFDRIARDADDARFLHDVFAVLIGIQHAGRFAVGVVLNLQRVGLGRRSSLPVASAFGISVYSVDHFAPDLQPWKQKPSCQQDARRSRGRLLIAMRPVCTVL